MKGSQPPDLVLVIDLSASLYVGIVDPVKGVLAARIREQAGRLEKGSHAVSGGRGESGHALLEECLSASGITLPDIGSICVGTGPGSFTGIRVGVAIAQGLGFTRQLPLYPYSSLAALIACASHTITLLGPSPVAAIAANAGRYFVFAEELGQTLLAGEALAALGTLHPNLITSGLIPDDERFRLFFPTVERMEVQMDFIRVVNLAKAGPPILDGIIRPNYLQASAAEEKRRTPGAEGAG